MEHGRIMKGIGGFYYVNTRLGVIECRARGKFRNESRKPMVGDHVEITVAGDGTGTVDQILERKNYFVRPPISNIDTLVIVAAAKNPAPDFVFIDKMTVIAKKNHVDAVLCVNKSDLSCEKDIAEITKIYTCAGFPVLVTSAKKQEGAGELDAVLQGKVTAFAGFSGVGKSSILNLLNDYGLETGGVSKKLKRGRHTTRHVELLAYKADSYVADTPGFSMLELPQMRASELEEYFPEFAPHLGKCRFTGCSHVGERDCAVKAAVEDGTVSKSRYQSYVQFYETLNAVKEWEI